MSNKELPFRISARSILVLIILVLAIIAVPWGQVNSNPQSTIEQFSAAVLSNDARTVKGLLEADEYELPVNEEQKAPEISEFVNDLQDDPTKLEKFVKASLDQEWETINTLYNPQVSSGVLTFDITEETVEELVKYWSSNLEELQKVRNQLQDQLKLINAGNDQAEFLKQFDVNIKKKGKALFIFDKYVLAVKPYFISVSSGADAVKIYMNDKEVGGLNRPGQKQVIGPFTPGNYKFKAVIASNPQDIVIERDLKLMQDPRSVIPVDLNFKMGKVRVKSNFADAKVFLNDQALNRSVGPGLVVGPLAFDGKTTVQLERTFPFGTYKSDKIAVKATGDLNVSIDPGKDPKMQDRIMATIRLYNEGWVNAFSNLDAGKLMKLSDKKKTQLSKQIDQLKVKDQKFKGRLMQLDFDIDSIKVEMPDQSFVQYLAYIDVRETYNNVANVSRDYLRYVLVYKDGEWKVDRSSIIEQFSGSNVRTERFSK